ncbi:EAL domain-containing protein [Pseudomonas sp. 2FE]|uniref:EAL domain-containing protein n=1 Tax=Pseudomonas sp. 2FE TaxID=2502190 RepID=UPI0010F87581|nr:EAL domain-containing protein [Pseudomonas sp. 2FE]
MNWPPNTGNRRILVIDDTPAIHQDFQKILGADLDGDAALASSEAALFGDAPTVCQAFELDSAYQGQEGLAMVRSAQAENRPYALAFVDMRMPPGWDGVETIERLWQVDPQLQIAFCSAYSDYSWEAMSERLELGDRLLILKKPFDNIEIRQMANALTVKWQMAQDAALKMSNLEQTVEDRALELLKISHLLQYDVLTELPNGTLLQDRLTQAIAIACRQRKQLAVIFLGLDRFKRINNALGHPIGDALLKSVAGCLVATVRKSDSVFRHGADKFVLLLADVTHSQQSVGIAQKLLAALRMPQCIAGHDLSITASLGISIYPDDGEDAETLIKKAEAAMQHAKENGRDDFRFFIPDMNLRAREQQSIEEGLRHALERHEFVLHYQPKLNLESGAITGAEALIRWQHPDRGFVSPAQFIPIAEDSGLIVPISQWVLREACRQARAWRDADLPPLSMAVNISALEFRSKDFLEGIRAVLLETRLEPRYLELEITEGVLMQDIESTGSVLRALKDMGVRLAIDDFGTGYSSLSYLRRFPVDVLKIDQSFVRDISTDANDAAIVSAIIGMGTSLKLQVIAEGVETQEQLAFLQAHRCEEGQGYYFSRPVAADAFATLLAGGMAERVQTSMSQICL